MALESSQRELQDFFRPHPNPRSEQEVMDAQSPGSPNWDSFGTPLWESREKNAIWMQPSRRAAENTIWGKVVVPPSPDHGESSESKLPVACPNTKGVPECELTNLWLVLDVGPCNKIIIPLHSLIPEPQHTPSTPSSAESWERAPSSKQFRYLAFLEPS